MTARSKKAARDAAAWAAKMEARARVVGFYALIVWTALCVMSSKGSTPAERVSNACATCGAKAALGAGVASGVSP